MHLLCLVQDTCLFVCMHVCMGIHMPRSNSRCYNIPKLKSKSRVVSMYQQRKIKKKQSIKRERKKERKSSNPNIPSKYFVLTPSPNSPNPQSASTNNTPQSRKDPIIPEVQIVEVEVFGVGV